MSDLYPLVSKLLPDGSVVMEERGKAGAVIAALKAYDYRTSLVRNFRTKTWEIWRRNEDESQSRIGTWRGEFLPEPDQVVRNLQEHDTRLGYDPLVAHAAAEALRQKHADADFEAQTLDTFDRVHYEMVDDDSIAPHAPAVRPIYLSN